MAAMDGGKKGGSKGGQTSSSAAKAGAPSRPAASTSRNATGAKSYRDTASGKSYDAPKYGGASVKGLTSKDPANVARNRAGAAKYSSVKDRIASSTRDGNADKAAARTASRAARPATPAPDKATPEAAAPKPTMTAVKPPVGYRPGIDPEFNYNAPTVTLAKGGKAKGKKK